MKKPRPKKSGSRRSDLRTEYRFDYSVSRPNRFAPHAAAGAEALKVDEGAPKGD